MHRLLPLAIVGTLLLLVVVVIKVLQPQSVQGQQCTNVMSPLELPVTNPLNGNVEVSRNSGLTVKYDWVRARANWGTCPGNVNTLSFYLAKCTSYPDPASFYGVNSSALMHNYTANPPDSNNITNFYPASTHLDYDTWFCWGAKASNGHGVSIASAIQRFKVQPLGGWWQAIGGDVMGGSGGVADPIPCPGLDAGCKIMLNL